MPTDIDFLDEIALGIAQAPRRSVEPLVFDYIRDLVPGDLVVLANAPKLAIPTPTLQRIRYSHHMIARLVALGKRDVEIAAITGHTQITIWRLKNQDPAFKELVAHYMEIKDTQFVDAAARLAVLGTTVVEELQERVEENPKAITTRELREIAEFAFDRSVAPAKGAGRNSPQGAGGPTVNLNVRFVSPRAPESASDAVIDVTPTTPQLEGPSSE